MSTQNIVSVIGGNGFVGQRVLQNLVCRNERVRCISRTGECPVHMQNNPKYNWANMVDWIKADAQYLEHSHLANSKAIICLVGAPPVPTFTQKMRDKQRALNGLANIRAIEVAEQLGVKRLVLLSAYIPKWLHSSYWGYYLGKADSITAAKNFCQISTQHSVTVVKPGLIFGRRYLASGKAIPLDVLFGPFARFSSGLFVSVDNVAECIVDSALDETRKGFHVLEKASL